MRPLCATSKTSLAVELMENLGDSLLAAVELTEGEVIVIVGADRTFFMLILTAAVVGVMAWTSLCVLMSSVLPVFRPRCDLIWNRLKQAREAVIPSLTR